MKKGELSTALSGSSTANRWPALSAWLRPRPEATALRERKVFAGPQHRARTSGLGGRTGEMLDFEAVSYLAELRNVAHKAANSYRTPNPVLHLLPLQRRQRAPLAQTHFKKLGDGLTAQPGCFGLGPGKKLVDRGVEQCHPPLKMRGINGQRHVLRKGATTVATRAQQQAAPEIALVG